MVASINFSLHFSIQSSSELQIFREINRMGEEASRSCFSFEWRGDERKKKENFNRDERKKKENFNRYSPRGFSASIYITSSEQ